MVARSVYLASDLPLAVFEPDPEHLQNPFPLASVVSAMDVLEKLEAVCAEKGEKLQRLLYEPARSAGTVPNPAVVGGMAKGLATSWQQPRLGRSSRPRKAKRISGLDEEEGYAESSED
eukprot:symbB.v1.2.013055.t1/scaffold868.1/size293455/10